MEDTRDRIVFLDIDNTLYSASTQISVAMGERIHKYFVDLGLPEDEANDLHHKYYSTYGLAVRGLTRHHDVDPLDFDAKCDGSLPLESILKPDPSLRKLLQDIDRTKVRVWALTNAYVNHAKRVLRILNLEDQIEGLIYCDYTQPNFSCKPEPDYYVTALETARVSDPTKCYFIDDSRSNVEAARRLGWGHCVHFVEKDMEAVEGGQVKKLGSDSSKMPGVQVVETLEQLRHVWAEIFVQTDAAK